jgi:type I restriction enzyme S subunit
MEKIKQGYKQTDIGVIPEDWEVKEIGEVGEVRMCRRIFNNETYSSGDIPLYKIGTFGKSPDAYISKEKYFDFRKRFSFPRKGDVLISAAGTIGRTIVYNGENAYFQDSNIVWIENDYKLISNELLFYIYQIIRYNTEGGTIQRLYNSILKAAKFACPTRIEQTAIATALSDTDALIAALDKKIAKKQQIKQGTMQQLLTGKKRLPGFSGEWVERSIWNIAEKNKSSLNDGDWIESPYITNDGIRLLQTGNIGIGLFKDKTEKKFISEESFDKLNCKEVLPNDILICRLAEPAGRTCLAPKSSTKMITSVDVSIFRPNEELYDRRFLLYVLNTPEWFSEINDRCGGSTRTRIARMQLGSICINIPENKSEQTAIAQILTDMDKEIARLEKKRDKYKEIKAGMMQVLLTGRVRLV